MNPHSQTFRFAQHFAWVLWPMSFALLVSFRLVGLSDGSWGDLVAVSFAIMLAAYGVLIFLALMRSVLELLGASKLALDEEHVGRLLDVWYLNRMYRFENYGEGTEPTEEDWKWAQAHFTALALEERGRQNRFLAGLGVGILMLILVGRLID